jgi:hypothetical protein
MRLRWTALVKVTVLSMRLVNKTVRRLLDDDDDEVAQHSCGN